MALSFIYWQITYVQPVNNPSDRLALNTVNAVSTLRAQGA